MEGGGGAHSLAGEGESQFRREDIHCGTLYNVYMYVLCAWEVLKEDPIFHAKIGGYY